MIFKSNFMGSMTSGLIIPPNKIDFEKVFDEMGSRTRENPYVLIVVCLLAGIYLMILIPVQRMDRRDTKMVSPIYCISNMFFQQHCRNPMENVFEGMIMYKPPHLGAGSWQTHGVIT